MAPVRPSPSLSGNSDSDNDDDGAPVAIPHTQAKRAVKSREAAREAVEAGERERRKERNRERDRRAKARKETVEEEDVESRMERAMREAQEEADEDSDADDSDADDDAQMSGGEGSQDDSASDEEADDDADMNASDADEHMSTNPNHLPEHLFTSAFAPSSPPAASTAKTKKALPVHKKRKRTGRGVKDLVVGSRTLRLSAPNTRPPIPATLPSRKIRKFTDRALALKGAGARAQKTWSRLPANLGVLRRAVQGPPAVGFVRGA
ncbi:hypothetical protein B0H14DRAFT_2759993 [Mycena olivaceomarginata]|nr:hypothetical protein B0H14DRAFT_2759993 [Mycena olivaceomarginata]